MADQQEQAYESPFQKDSILELSDVINRAVIEYARKNDTKVDIFVVLASLGHAAFHTSLALVNGEDMAVMNEQMKEVTHELLLKLDAVRVEKDNHHAIDLIASTHLLSSLSEIYSKRRDNTVIKILQDEAQASK